MEKKWLKIEGYQLFITALLSLGSIFIFLNLFSFELWSAAVFILVAVIMSVLYFIDKHHNSSVFYIICTISIFLLLFLCIINWDSIINFIKEYIKWLNHRLVEQEESQTSYTLLTVGVMLLVLVSFFYVLQRYFVVRIGLAISILILFLLGGIKELDFGRNGVILLLMYVFTILLEVAAWYRRKNKMRGAKHTPIMELQYLVVVIILFGFIMVFMPSDKEPMQWRLVKGVLSGVGSTVEDWYTNIRSFIDKDYGRYEMKFSGYGDSSKIGGDLELSDEEVLKLSSKTILENNIYLTGSVRNVYTSVGWEDETESPNYLTEYVDYKLDLIELLWGMYIADMFSQPGRIIKNQELLIEYSGIETKSIFYPLKMHSFKLNDSDANFDDHNTNMVFDRLQDDIKYTLQYFNINLDSVAFDQLLQKLKSFSYEDYVGYDYKDFIIAVSDEFPSYNVKIPLQAIEILRMRSKTIEQLYMNLPEELPERITELTKDITKEAKTKYDKLKAIEAFLNTYEYTTRPGSVPEGRDVVDYFLFDGKKGYCTYFASAMGVMARTIGIPTRYVQGYCLWHDNKTPGAVFTIEERSAHAWTEAYIEGIGWIPFEPTGSYAAIRYTPWEGSLSEGNGGKSQGGNSANEQYNHHVIDPIQEYYDELLRKHQESEKRNKEKQTYGYFVLFITIALLIFMLLFALIFMIKIRKNRRNYLEASPSLKAYYNMNIIMGYLGYAGYKLDTGETVLQFASRIGMQYSTRERNLTTLAMLYSRLRYCEKSITSRENVLFEEYLAFLHSVLKDRYGRFKIFILKMRLYRKGI